MERDGWITRAASPRDRRIKLVRPTPRVQPVWDRITTSARRIRARAIQGLAPAEVKRMMKMLSHIQGNLNSSKVVKEVV
jgi:DNA-binding MarR family transcriptional regulator